MKNGLLKKGELPKKRITPSGKELRSAQGHIDTSALSHYDFAEDAAVEYRHGHNGHYFNGVSSMTRRMAPQTEQFAESTLCDECYTTHLDRVHVPKPAKDLWKLVRNHLHVPGNVYSNYQISEINRFLNDPENQEVATELVVLRDANVPLTQAQRTRRWELEKALQNTLSWLTQLLRSE
jgi:hypothetical protein